MAATSSQVTAPLPAPEPYQFSKVWEGPLQVTSSGEADTVNFQYLWSAQSRIPGFALKEHVRSQSKHEVLCLTPKDVLALDIHNDELRVSLVAGVSLTIQPSPTTQCDKEAWEKITRRLVVDFARYWACDSAEGLNYRDVTIHASRPRATSSARAAATEATLLLEKHAGRHPPRTSASASWDHKQADAAVSPPAASATDVLTMPTNDQEAAASTAEHGQQQQQQVTAALASMSVAGGAAAEGDQDRQQADEEAPITVTGMQQYAHAAPYPARQFTADLGGNGGSCAGLARPRMDLQQPALMMMAGGYGGGGGVVSPAVATSGLHYGFIHPDGFSSPTATSQGSPSMYLQHQQQLLTGRRSTPRSNAVSRSHASTPMHQHQQQQHHQAMQPLPGQPPLPPGPPPEPASGVASPATALPSPYAHSQQQQPLMVALPLSALQQMAASGQVQISGFPQAAMGMQQQQASPYFRVQSMPQPSSMGSAASVGYVMAASAAGVGAGTAAGYWQPPLPGQQQYVQPQQVQLLQHQGAPPSSSSSGVASGPYGYM